MLKGTERMDHSVLTTALRVTTEAAFDDAAWDEFAATLGAQVFKARVGLDHQFFLTAADFGVQTSFGLDLECAHKLTVSLSRPEDHIAYAALMHSKLFKPLLFEDITDAETFKSDPSIQIFFPPQGLDKVATSALMRDGPRVSYFSLFRGVGQDDFSRDDLLAAELVSRQIELALRVRALRIERAAAREGSKLLASASGGRRGVIYATAAGRVLWMDEIAEALIAAQSVLVELGGRLVSRSRRSEDGQEALARFLAASAKRATETRMHIFVSPGNVIRLTATPISGDVLGVHGSGSAIGLVIEGRPTGESYAVEAVAAAFALTPREAEFLRHLAAADGLANAAEAMRVSRNTAKTHLGRIFEKTGTRSQTALMALLGAYR